MASEIRCRESREGGTVKEDHVLVGLMSVLKELLQKFPVRKVEIGSRLVSHLLHDCLF